MGGRIEFLVRRLTEEGQAVLAESAALAPTQWDEPVYPGKPPWSVREVLAHLLSADQAFAKAAEGVSEFDGITYRDMGTRGVAVKGTAGVAGD